MAKRGLLLTGLIILLSFFLASCTPQDATGKASMEFEEHGADPESLLVPLEDTVKERENLKSDMLAAISSTKDMSEIDAALRNLYEEYIDIIGANGIKQVLHDADPNCHSTGHSMGRVVFARLRQIGPALLACGDVCRWACMHGVMMEAFTIALGKEYNSRLDHHVLIEDIKPILPTFCQKENMSAYGIETGNCAHGVGHALMFMADYDVSETLNGCYLFDNKPLEFYCATGAFMEYMNNYEERDAETQDFFYPCDTVKFPGACFMYKTRSIIYRLGRMKKDNIALISGKCKELTGHPRLGCILGLGNVYGGLISQGWLKVDDVCAFENSTEQQVCIEGAVMQYLDMYNSTVRLCNKVKDDQKELCFKAAEQGLVGLDRDWELYVN